MDHVVPQNTYVGVRESVIHALPCMGADHRLYPEPWFRIPGFVSHDWLPYQGEQTLAEVALMIARTHDIQDGDSVVGSSLGGMVACEIAKIRRLDLLVLIGSAQNKDEIAPVLATLHPLAAHAPINELRFLAGMFSSELAQMFAQAEVSFIRAMCAAIFRWEGLGATSVRCIRIHGSKDLIIPPPGHVDLLLDGGHFIPMTHAKECVEFIEALLRRGNAFS